MKIAIDCHTLEVENWAGKEQVLFNFLLSLKANDKINDYILYCRRQVLKAADWPQRWQIKSWQLPSPLWQLIVLLHCLIQKVDVLVAPCAYLLPAINVFCANVVILHDVTTIIPDIAPTHKLGIKIKEKLFLRLALRRAKVIIAVSEHTKKDAVKYFNIAPNKIDVIYPGCRFNQSLISLDILAAEKLSEHHLPLEFILFVGTLEPRKNLNNLILAYKQLHDRQKAIPSLLIVGKKGWYYQDIFNLVATNNLTNKVVFAGYLPNELLPYLYNKALVTVYPSLYEGFGLPALEAMACGSPVIATNTSSVSEVTGQAAILVNPYSVDEIADAMHKVLTSPDLQQTMRKQGLQQAAQFSWLNFVQSFLTIINQITK